MIIAVASNRKLEDGLKKQADEKKLQLIDVGSIIKATNNSNKEKAAKTICEQFDKLLPGELVLCMLPSLPKTLFDELVLSSQLPTLAEGANLTSFLLQNGHPHLSVLPSGQTPVAQDMGSPLEAIKAEAFSYKLGINEREQKFLESLKELVEKGDYEQALHEIKVLNKRDFKQLAFLWRTPDQDPFLGLEQLTIGTLLKKGSALGEAGKQTLMSAIDPSPQAFGQYTHQAMNADSPTVRHFKLQQMHVNRQGE